jgi:ketosteroid isomerase-like protein
MKKPKQFLALLTIIFLTSCNNGQTSNATTSGDDLTTIKELTNKWNDCVVKQDMQTLATLYADQASVYGVSISKAQAISNKEDFFKKHTDFNQSITGDITVTKVTDNQHKVSFPKRSSFSGKTSDVKGHLLFDKVDGNWKITNESDDVTDKNVSKIKQDKSDGPKIGQSIGGDFDGDGVNEFAFSVKTKEGKGNPFEDGTSDEYAVNFSNDKLKSLPVSCCGFLLVNEGDLNNDGSDEFTIFQSPMNGCTNFVRTFTYSKGTWKELYEPFMYSVGCGVDITDEEFLNWVTLENGSVYYREPDPNDEHLLNADGDKIIFSRLLKTKAKLK